MPKPTDAYPLADCRNRPIARGGEKYIRQFQLGRPGVGLLSIVPIADAKIALILV